MLPWIFDLKYFRLPHKDTSTELHIRKVLHSLSQLPVNSDRSGDSPSIIYPVTRLDDLCRLIGSSKFTLVHCFKIHRSNILLTT